MVITPPLHYAGEAQHGGSTGIGSTGGESWEGHCGVFDEHEQGGNICALSHYDEVTRKEDEALISKSEKMKAKTAENRNTLKVKKPHGTG